MISAGELKNSLFLQEKETDVGQVIGWRRVKRNPLVRCSFMRNDGATKQSNAGEQQIQTLQIKCRWRPDITDDMGFTDGASHPTDFDIVGIDNVRMMNRVLIITLEKRSAT